MASRVPRPPAGLGSPGRKLWRAVQREYELEQHEEQLLLEMARTSDALDRLSAAVAGDGELVEDRFGQQRPHPALVELRQQRIAYARLSAALRLPAGEDEGERRPQRRAGVRGTYNLRSVS